MNRRERRAARKSGGAVTPPGRPRNSARADGLLAQAISHFQIGDLGAAEAACRNILSGEPKCADAFHLLGVIALNRGQTETAVELIGRALSIDDGNAEYHYNIGLALGMLGRFEQSAGHSRIVVDIIPDHAEAHMNLGNALLALGRFDEALRIYERTVALQPAAAPAHFNIGNIRFRSGDYSGAIRHYRAALKAQPDFADAHINLARALFAEGETGLARDDIIRALEYVKRLLRTHDDPEARSLFVDCIKSLSFETAPEELYPFIVRALLEPWGRPAMLGHTVRNLLRLHVPIREAFDRAATAWPGLPPVSELTGPGGLDALLDHPLLIPMLHAAPIAGIDFERFLTICRAGFLADAAAGRAAASERELAFRIGLASQCFTNEYVFALSPHELTQAVELRGRVAAALADGRPIRTEELVSVAMYFPLDTVPLAKKLLERVWPESLAALLAQQIREPLRERELKAAIPRLTDTEDETSRSVRGQYEENPYPRWLRIAPVFRPATFRAFFGRTFPHVPLAGATWADAPELLIAGCGTGQQSVVLAKQLPAAKILAIDFSLASLGYAKRKTDEACIANIEYAQADILKLGSLDRSFDVIYADGVLHHLREPAAGWRQLVGILRPGGLMHVSLYSETARREIVAAQRAAAEGGFSEAPDDIRRFRQTLIGSGPDSPWGVLARIDDLRSLSGCRDLLFHRQEHRFTIPMIAEFLAANGLKFIGFELDSGAAQRFAARFPGPLGAADLAKWEVFERENPHTFIEMYQFWITKPETAATGG